MIIYHYKYTTFEIKVQGYTFYCAKAYLLLMIWNKIDLMGKSCQYHLYCESKCLSGCKYLNVK